MNCHNKYAFALLLVFFGVPSWFGLGTVQAQQTWSSPRIQVRFAEIPRPKLPAR
jgi:hypothetical protein